MTTPPLNFWPLVVVIEDVYGPELAEVTLNIIAGLDSEIRAAMLVMMSCEASYLVAGRRN